MTMPFYVAPEQVMKDRADYARKGIARGRSTLALVYDAGVVVVAENPSSTLRKISEIYDRIAFAGVGRYNEYDQLRRAGVRSADLTGYSFSREDVNARSLATSYAQYLGQVFTHEMKPMEVEILVVEVGSDPSADELYHILFDGTVMDEDNFSVMGGDPDEIVERLEQSWKPNLSLTDAIKAAAAALSGPDRTLGADELEVAALERNARQRAFRRIEGDELAAIVPPSARPVSYAGEPKADLPPVADDTSDKAGDEPAKRARAAKKATEDEATDS